MRKALPFWWDDSVADEPAGLQQAQMYLARAFNIDIRCLLDSKQPVTFEGAVRKFKLTKGVCELDVRLSAHFATGIARIALATMPGENAAPPSAEALRALILKTSCAVDLPALLKWCTSARIPVLHINTLPGKKMTGLVVRQRGRFAVVLGKKAHPAYLLFHLAHELGHIAEGHLPQDGFVADQSIAVGSGEGSDSDEKEADAYAIRLLNGREVAYKSTRQYLSGERLAAAAVDLGGREGVDPGHIILNLAHAQRNFPLGNAALKLLPAEPSGAIVVNRHFFSSLSTDDVSEETLDLLHSATGYVTPTK